MKLRRQQLLKVVAFAVLICLSAFTALVAYNALSYLQSEDDPLAPLPTLDVYYLGLEEGVRLPTEYIRLDKYDWRFLFWRREGGGKDLQGWQEIKSSGLIPPLTNIDLVFSYKPKSYAVYIMPDGAGSFTEMEPDLIAPAMDGTYVIRVDGNWGEGRDITYYIKVSVVDWT